MNELEIEEKYKQIPLKLRQEKRWCLYGLRNNESGHLIKIPGNAMTGKTAKVNDPNTWTTFNIACAGLKKYKNIEFYDKNTMKSGIAETKGLGFVLGDGFFGVDLDFHPQDYTEEERPKKREEFQEIVKEFSNHLDTYTEYSQSGEGIHFICKGYLPEGNRRKGCVEMYDNVRYFAMTGNSLLQNVDIVDCSEKIKPLFDKYLADKEKPSNNVIFGNQVMSMFEDQQVIYENQIVLNDNEVLETIREKDKTGLISFLNGIRPDSDESRNDYSLMKNLAFWCDKNALQMERIFVNSEYFKSKDKAHKNKWLNRKDYAQDTIQKAIDNTINTYKKFEHTKVEKYSFTPVTKQTFKNFDLTDTGNAEHFAFYYSDIIKYNNDDQKFLVYNGKIWEHDTKENILVKRYVDEFILMLKEKSKEKAKEIKELYATIKGNEEDELINKKITYLEKAKTEFDKNIGRISNQNGKNALINELKHLENIPINNLDLDKNANELNTQSGIVNMVTGEIRPHSKDDFVTRITSCGISKEPPKQWLKFLDDIWTHESILESEKKEMIDFFQKYLGYCLTGNKQNEICGIMYGTGGNGKSVIVETLNSILATNNLSSYGKPINGDLFGTGKTAGNIENAFAEIYGIRLGIINETDKQMVLNATFVKKIASHGEQLAGRFLYGNTFYFYPIFKPLIITNHTPKIEDTDDGIWDRVFIIPLPNKFRNTPKEDLFLNDKLRAELPSILWWIIQGNMKLIKENNGKIFLPECIKKETERYRQSNDVVAKFLDDLCDLNVGGDYKTQASILYKEFTKWCLENKENIIPNTAFKNEMTIKGYKQIRNSKGKYYLGVKLLADKKGHSFLQDMED